MFTTRFSGGKGGRNGLGTGLRRLGIRQKNGKPDHPQTQENVERFQQTLKNWLRAQPSLARALVPLRALLDAFASVYNHERPHHLWVMSHTVSVSGVSGSLSRMR